jgi:hypothetical protein
MPLGFVRETIVRIRAFDGTRSLVQDLISLLNERLDLLDEFGLITVFLLPRVHIFNMLQAR